MQHDQSETPHVQWEGVGYYPTPETLVTDLAEKVVSAWIASGSKRRTIRVLDACAADGRLGFAVRNRLMKVGMTAELTFLEVDRVRIPGQAAADLASSINWVVGNFLDHYFESEFDIVVSNPPYLSLDKKTANLLGLEWAHAVRGGMNLYGMALLRALEVCREGGIVGFIAPHGWLRNSRMSLLRQDVARLAGDVRIFASPTRREFPGVTQDTSVQTFSRINHPAERGGAANITLSYSGADVSLELSPSRLTLATDLRVRVGPFVWNRESHLIAKNPSCALPVIYGGNIGSGGEVDYTFARYRDRQYLDAYQVPPSYVSRGPCIVVKRSMRGGPGNWIVDCSYLKQGHEFVAENHVIVVSGIRSCLAKIQVGKDFATKLAVRLAEINRDHGHPNLSANSVRSALADLWPTAAK